MHGLTAQPYLFNQSPQSQVLNSMGCETCTQPSNSCPSTEYMSWVDSCYCEPATTEVSKPWIDIYLRDNFQFGYRVIDANSGVTDLGLIPQYLMQFCPPQTQPNSRGYKMGEPFCIKGTQGNWQQYVKVAGTRAYQYIKNLDNGEERDGGNWDFGIYDCAIKTLDADKLFNYCSLFRKVAEPLSNYFDNATGGLTPGFRQIPIVVSTTLSQDQSTSGCKLYSLYKCSDARACVIPYLTTTKGAVWDYNAVTDVVSFKPQNLANLIKVGIDGTTMRAIVPGKSLIEGLTSGGDSDNPNGTVLSSYTYVDSKYLAGDGTPQAPVKIKTNSIDTLALQKCPGITSDYLTNDSIFERIIDPTNQSQGSVILANSGLNQQSQVLTRVVPFSWTGITPVGCADKDWLAQIVVNWSSAVNIASVKLAIHADVQFTSGVNKVYGRTDKTFFTTSDSILKNTSAEYTDSSGPKGYGMALIKINGDGNNVCTLEGELRLRITIPNAVSYNSIFTPINAAPINQYGWFDTASVVINLISKTSK
jgi:hypothetical protein